MLTPKRKRPVTAGAHLKRLAAADRAPKLPNGQLSPWPHTIRPVTPQSVNSLWDTVERLNDPKAAEESAKAESNHFMESVQQHMKIELDNAGCLPTAPDPGRVQIFGEALGMIADHMGPFQEMLTSVKRMYDCAVEHY